MKEVTLLGKKYPVSLSVIAIEQVEEKYNKPFHEIAQTGKMGVFGSILSASIDSGYAAKGVDKTFDKSLLHRIPIEELTSAIEVVMSSMSVGSEKK